MGLMGVHSEAWDTPGSKLSIMHPNPNPNPPGLDLTMTLLLFLRTDFETHPPFSTLAALSSVPWSSVYVES